MKALKVIWIIYVVLFLLIALFTNLVFAVFCVLYTCPVLIGLILLTISMKLSGTGGKATKPQTNQFKQPVRNIHIIEKEQKKEFKPAVMHELVCPNCGSKEFSRKHDGYVCNYCGSEFFVK